MFAVPPAAAGSNELAFGAGKTCLLGPLFRPGSKLEMEVASRTACAELALGTLAKGLPLPYAPRTGTWILTLTVNAEPPCNFGRAAAS